MQLGSVCSTIYTVEYGNIFEVELGVAPMTSDQRGWEILVSLYKIPDLNSLKFGEIRGIPEAVKSDAPDDPQH